MQQHPKLGQPFEHLQGFLEEFGVEGFKVLGKAFPEVFLCRRSNGREDVAFIDRWAVLGFDTGIVPGALGAQPKRQRGDLCRAGVDVDAVEVVFDDQAGDVAEVGFVIGVGLG